MATSLQTQQTFIQNGITSTISETKEAIMPYLTGARIPDYIIVGSSGTQTTPLFSRETMLGTVTAKTNASLAHSCDFKFDLGLGAFSLPEIPNPVAVIKKAIAEGKNAAAQIIQSLIAQAIDGFRLAIKGIIIALNFDTTGILSTAFSVAKQVIRFLNEKLKQIAEYVAIASLYYHLVTSVQQIIDFIKTLPAKVKALIQECFTKFTNGIKNATDKIKSIGGATSGGLTGVINTLNASSQAALDDVNKQSENESIPPSLKSLVNGESVTAEQVQAGVTSYVATQSQTTIPVDTEKTDKKSGP